MYTEKGRKGYAGCIKYKGDNNAWCWLEDDKKGDDCLKFGDAKPGSSDRLYTYGC